MRTELFLKGRLRHDLSADEKRALEDAVVDVVKLDPRKTLVERGERIENSYYIIEGTMLRHIDDRRGERQLVGLNVTGDFVDLHGFPMKRLDHNVASLDTVTLAKVPHTAIARLVESVESEYEVNSDSVSSLAGESYNSDSGVRARDRKQVNTAVR